MTKKMILQLILILSVLVTPVCFGFGYNPINDPYTIGTSDWWDYNWHYRIEVTITNTGFELSEYQILLEFDSINHYNLTKTNGDDIRIIDDDLAELSYWMEAWNIYEGYRIWTKIPTIPASAQKTIYIYYGNPYVSKNSNGALVFEFFDDFSGTLSNWDVDNAYTEDGILTIGSSSNYIKSKTNFTGPIIVECLKKMSGNRRHNFGFSPTFPHIPGDGNSTLEHSGDGLTYIYDGFDDTLDSLIFTENTWILSTLTWLNNSAILAYDRDEEITKNSDSIPIENLYLGIQTWATTTAPLYVDWIFVRQYSALVPSQFYGEEEFQNIIPTPPTITLPPETITVTINIKLGIILILIGSIFFIQIIVKRKNT